MMGELEKVEDMLSPVMYVLVDEADTGV